RGGAGGAGTAGHDGRGRLRRRAGVEADDQRSRLQRGEGERPHGAPRAGRVPAEDQPDADRGEHEPAERQQQNEHPRSPVSRGVVALRDTGTTPRRGPFLNTIRPAVSDLIALRAVRLSGLPASSAGAVRRGLAQWAPYVAASISARERGSSGWATPSRTTLRPSGRVNRVTRMNAGSPPPARSARVCPGIPPIVTGRSSTTSRSSPRTSSRA